MKKNTKKALINLIKVVVVAVILVALGYYSLR